MVSFQLWSWWPVVLKQVILQGSLFSSVSVNVPVAQAKPAAKCCFRWALTHQNLLLGNSVQRRSNWIRTAGVHVKFAISTRVFWSMIKMSCLLSSHNYSPKKAAQPSFSGLPFTPRADRVFTSPAALDNAVHSIMNFIWWCSNEKSKISCNSGATRTCPLSTIHMKLFVAFKITNQISSITREI